MLFFKLAIAVRNIMSMFAESNANGYLIKYKYVIAIFVATGCVFSAKIIGYLSPVGYDTCVIICSLARMGKGSLLLFTNLYFHS